MREGLFHLEKQISYYEFLNGHVVKFVASDGVYQLAPCAEPGSGMTH